MKAQYHGIIKKLWSITNRFDYEKYWKMRDYVVTRKRGIKAWIYLLRIKRMDSFHNASMGTHLSFNSAEFESHPVLPHGLNGIIVANDAHVGKNCTIFQQVTIGLGNGGAPTIGDNVLIGAGAKIIGPIRIGNNVKVGAGCVVSIDIPDDATVVAAKPRVLFKS